MNNGLTEYQKSLLSYLSKQEAIFLDSSDSESYEGMEYQGKVVGAYDGYTAADVNVKVNFAWDLFTLNRLTLNTVEWAKDLFPAIKRTVKYKSTWALREWAKFYHPHLSPSCWTFVVDSLETFRYDIAYKTLGRSKASKSNGDAIRQLAAAYTRQDLIDHILNNGYTMTGPGIYSADSDPTCFAVDNSLFPYNLKNGWSGTEIARFVSIWMSYMGYGEKKVVWTENNI